MPRQGTAVAGPRQLTCPFTRRQCRTTRRHGAAIKPRQGIERGDGGVNRQAGRPRLCAGCSGFEGIEGHIAQQRHGVKLCHFRRQFVRADLGCRWHRVVVGVRSFEIEAMTGQGRFKGPGRFCGMGAGAAVAARVQRHIKGRPAL